jgi:hypothetical protein
VEKYCRTEQVTDEYLVQALCMKDVLGYKQTLRICDTYCFSTAMVAKTRLNVRYMFISCLVLLNSLTAELRALDVFSRFILHHFVIELRDSDILSYYLIHRVITESTNSDICLLSYIFR